MCSGNVGNAFGARQNVLQGNGTRVQGIRGLRKPERNLPARAWGRGNKKP